MSATLVPRHEHPPFTRVTSWLSGAKGRKTQLRSRAGAFSAGKLLLGVLASIAEFEIDIRRERQREGIDRAKAAGVYKGRKPTVDTALVHSLREQGVGPSEIAKRLKIGRASVYRALGK